MKMTQQQLQDGQVLLVNKPLKWTSFDAINRLRNAFKIKKIGHAGTLDPLATGLLIICTGKYTKRINEYMGMEKEYTGTITLGATTPTYDLESEPENFLSTDGISDDQIYAATQHFIGDIMQIPPAHSAIKIGGKRVYEMARSGEEVVLQPRPVNISVFEITRIALPEVDFRVVCTTGTYIRSLVNDFGKALGCGGYLSALCRTRIGTFMLSDALPPVAWAEKMLKVSKTPAWNWDHSYQRLPAIMYASVLPTPVAAPQTVIWNQALATELGLPYNSDDLQTIGLVFSGNQIPENASPLAQAYMGHQFGYPNMLGDGRAILLGEHITPQQQRFDIQLKGPGQTPYSRRGDGRATLSSMLREYLISEAMHHFGIPTTRSLAVVATGELVFREAVQPGGILTRIAASHIRVGTFEFATRQLQKEDFQQFTRYVIERHYPALRDTENEPLALLQAVMERQASLIAEWVRVGFIHGVMNTDNMSMAGETIDYGPCAFMNAYDPATVFSSIDTNGRYAFGNQPTIAQWNLGVLASALLPLIHEDVNEAISLAKAVIHEFPDLYNTAWTKMMRKKLGLKNSLPQDRALMDDLLTWMHQAGADYTNTFFYLTEQTFPDEAIYQEDGFKIWHERWQQRLTEQYATPTEIAKLMRAANPAFIPRNHLVEAALQAATMAENMDPFLQLLEVVQQPYVYRDEFKDYQHPAAGGDAGYKTFCGT